MVMGPAAGEVGDLPPGSVPPPAPLAEKNFNYL